MANLPETKESYNTIINITEYLIKYTQFIPCCMGDNKLSVVQVAELFFKHVICKFGIPDDIVSDRDHRFVSTFWQHLWKLMGTKTLMSTAFHPQTDGQTERMIRTLA